MGQQPAPRSSADHGVKGCKRWWRQLGEGATHSQALRGQKPGGMREQSVDFHFPLAFLLFLIAFKGMLSCCVCPERGVS